MAETLTLRTADQILAMFDNGDFLLQFLTDHQALILALHNHQMTHGGKAKGKGKHKNQNKHKGKAKGKGKG